MTNLDPQFTRLTQQVAAELEILTVSVETLVSAETLRFQFYGFRKLARKQKDPIASLANAIGVRILPKGKSYLVEFYPKDSQPEALALDRALNRKEDNVKSES